METLFVFKVSFIYLQKLSFMKEKITDKASEMFLSYGFKSVTMDDIAASLAISKKTIYQHFENKTKLVEEVTFTLFEKICGGIDQISERTNNSIEELYEIKLYVMNHLNDEKASPQFQLKKYYPYIYDELKAKQFEVMKDSVYDSVIKGIEMGLFRDSIDAPFISRMYFNGMSGIKDANIFPPEEFPMNSLMESYLEYHLRAIVTEKGMKILQKFIKNN